MSAQYIVATLVDGTLNVRAAGPYRSRARAEIAAERIDSAGEWTESADASTIISQVVRLEPLPELLRAIEPELRTKETMDQNCGHPDGIYLYPATDEDGNDLAVFRCTECGAKYVEGA